MRSKKRKRIRKKPYSQQRINKKRYRKARSWSWSDDVSGVFLSNINEKVHRAEGGGSWKIVPKDSCEVYKDRYRRRRLQTNHRKDDKEDREDRKDSYDDTSYDSNMDVDRSESEEQLKEKKNPRKKQQKKRIISKKYKKSESFVYPRRRPQNKKVTSRKYEKNSNSSNSSYSSSRSSRTTTTTSYSTSTDKG